MEELVSRVEERLGDYRMVWYGEIFLPQQRLTQKQAFATYTVNPAFAAFEEDIKGTLSPGKLADITVLSRDIMTVPEEDIPSTDVIFTIIDGEVRYSADR